VDPARTLGDPVRAIAAEADHRFEVRHELGKIFKIPPEGKNLLRRFGDDLRHLDVNSLLVIVGWTRGAAAGGVDSQGIIERTISSGRHCQQRTTAGYAADQGWQRSPGDS